MTGIEEFVQFVRQLPSGVYQKKDSDGNDIQVEFALNPPATIEQICAAEEGLGTKLPPSFREFLLNYNGGRMYDYEGLDGFEIFRVQEIQQVTLNVQSHFGDEWRDGLVVFAEYIGEGNFLAFAPRNEELAEVIDCFVEEFPSNWESIAGDFGEFLGKLLAAHGSKYWLTGPAEAMTQ